MPFGLPYNEAANPRATSLQAWLNAAATTSTCKHYCTFHMKRHQHVND